MKHLDLFSGIGGFALGLQWAGGFETVAFCEIDKFCQKVLAKNFPSVPIIEDIHDVTNESLAGKGITKVDLITAGFPCQPFSRNGKKQGFKDQRFLWEELFRIIADTKPSYVLLENVPELLTNSKGIVAGGILFDLASLGYVVEWAIIPASAIGAPHRRERVWIIAYPDSLRCKWSASQRQASQERGYFKAEAFCSSRSERWNSLPTSRFCRSSDGIPNRVDRTRALGNAVVPQLVQMLGQRLVEFAKEMMRP